MWPIYALNLFSSLYSGPASGAAVAGAGSNAGSGLNNAAAASSDLMTLKQFDVDSRFAGWVTCFIDKV